jgi:hypothetical protein
MLTYTAVLGKAEIQGLFCLHMDYLVGIVTTSALRPLLRRRLITS